LPSGVDVGRHGAEVDKVHAEVLAVQKRFQPASDAPGIWRSTGIPVMLLAYEHRQGFAVASRSKTGWGWPTGEMPTVHAVLAVKE
jgi:hypothetical protein